MKLVTFLIRKLFNTEHPEKSDKYISLNKYFYQEQFQGTDFV